MKAAVVFLLITMLVNLGCSGGSNSGPEKTPNEIKSIAIEPSNLSIIQTAVQQFTAMGTFSDSSTEDITTSVTWSSSDTAIATINNTGIATAIASGSTTINASIGSITGSTALIVTSTSSDTSHPMVTITSPTSNVTYDNGNEDIVSLGGSASDNVGVTMITWENGKGSCGTLTGTTSWTIADIPLSSGTNNITVTAHDAAGNVGTDSIAVTYTPESVGPTYFIESFENINYSSRNWYDGTSAITSETLDSNGFSGNCMKWTFTQGASTPTGMSTIRKAFTATEALYVKFYWKFSAVWRGSQQTYHPHLIYILSNLDYADNPWSGLAGNYLDTYIETLSDIGSPYTIRPLIAIQDYLSVNEALCSGILPCDLTAITENRSVAGCNGTLGDTGTSQSCYDVGDGSYTNYRAWKAGPSSIPRNQWVKVEVYLEMNSISEGKAIADGVLKEWIDGILIINSSNVVYRTNQHPSLKWEEIILAPYIGSGSPIIQTMWMDELTVGTSNPHDTDQ